jgi:Zn-dependent protease/CBS domain-containing protein
MYGGVRIGRIFGISIHVDWSWIFIFLLVTWNLSALFGNLHPNWEVVLRWGIALAAALLFFASVLAHELAHSLVARAFGVPVRNITLFLFGGVSNIQRHPPSPQAEFMISIVGPATSILLGVLFVYLSGTRTGPFGRELLDPPGLIAQLDPLSTLLLWLGPVNIVLGFFNLIPGFPLDGGRILRSILWVITDNLRRATRWASGVGQVIAWLMIAAGIAMAFGARLPFFGTGLINGLWLAFIGWFLNSASVQSYQQVVVQDILEGVPVQSMMRADAPAVSPGSSISNLVYDHVMGTDERSFPVLEEGRLAGVVTLEDIRAVPRDEWERITVREIMTPVGELVVVSPGEDAAEALNKMMQRDVRQLPVVQNGRLVGLLRRRDIMRWLQLQSDIV